MDARRLDADDERLRDLAIGVAAGDEREDLRLTRCEPEDLLEVLRAMFQRDVGRREIEPRALGEQLELSGQGPRSDSSRDGVRRLSGTPASVRGAPAATSASASRQRQ